jgi:hypothetical protein
MKRRPARQPPVAAVPSEAPPEAPRQIDDECWDALLLDDDYEPPPEPGDFWIEPDAA